MNNNIYSLQIFIILFFASIIFCACDANSQSFVKNIDVEKAKKLIQEENNLQIIDVRTNEEIALTGTIKGAKEIDWYDKTFEDQISIFSIDKPILVYCKSGGRSVEAAKLLKKKGFKKVYNLVRGMTSWNK